ncbi:unnamed protein product [Cladocopium goreaui]|uniref:Uncharacterized protein n=1 Tax=Cladocopium goreaui TaxID=2562237 RepID=A0A9P1CQL2_9DINO|nr:unnamed protein product [Cladocopium goreaui]
MTSGLPALLRSAGLLAFVFLLLTWLKKRRDRDRDALTGSATALSSLDCKVATHSDAWRPIPPKPKRPPPKPKNRSEETTPVVGKLPGGG